MTFSKSPEESVGQGVLSEVAEHLIVNLESGEVGYIPVSPSSQILHNLHTGVDDGLFGVSLNRGSLVTGGIDELVVDDQN